MKTIEQKIAAGELVTVREVVKAIMPPERVMDHGDFIEVDLTFDTTKAGFMGNTP